MHHRVGGIGRPQSFWNPNYGNLSWSIGSASSKFLSPEYSARFSDTPKVFGPCGDTEAAPSGRTWKDHLMISEKNKDQSSNIVLFAAFLAVFGAEAGSWTRLVVFVAAGVGLGVSSFRLVTGLPSFRALNKVYVDSRAKKPKRPTFLVALQLAEGSKDAAIGPQPHCMLIRLLRPDSQRDLTERELRNMKRLSCTIKTQNFKRTWPIDNIMHPSQNLWTLPLPIEVLTDTDPRGFRIEKITVKFRRRRMSTRLAKFSGTWTGSEFKMHWWVQWRRAHLEIINSASIKSLEARS